MDTERTVEGQISAWSKKRPRWQQDILRRLATGAPIRREELERVADDLVKDEHQTAAPLNESEIPSALGRTSTISLESIGGIANVNALVAGEKLTFGTAGLTVVYGDNASGKSGYARIIKSISGALDDEPVHPNVFANTDGGQEAEIKFCRDDETDTAIWPSNIDEDLRAIRFYDEACGNTYISRDSELTYRPSALALLDGLVDVCDKVRLILNERLNQINQARGRLPTPNVESDSATFLESLTASTTRQEVDDACLLPHDADEQRRTLSEEELRLRGTDPATERNRLQVLADTVEALSQHVATLVAALSDEAVNAAIDAQTASAELRSAAALASEKAFGDEPVSGVGTETWRAMWDAAREYSQAEAYHGHEFPVTDDDARCVLCQQILSADSSERLVRFERFVQDKTAQRASAAEKAVEAAEKTLVDLEAKPSEIAIGLATLEPANSQLAEQVGKWLDAADERRMVAIRRISGQSVEEVPPLGTNPRTELDTYAEVLRTDASEVDTTQLADHLAGVTKQRINLDGRVALAQGKAAVYAEVVRLKKQRAIERAKQATDTTAVTREASEIMKSSVTNHVRARFQTESEHMLLARVELKATGGRKGKLQQRPLLLGVTTTTPLREVLSEGEQTALGLAGFFTEAHFDASGSALVLDDPITSLDHRRRARVADRIVEFAKKRQVIVFTHEIAFVVEISRAVEEAGLAVTERRIERIGESSPGKIGDSFPWKAKDVGMRISALEEDLARIKRERPRWTQEKYEGECADWAGRLSETWERLVHLEIVGQVFDPATFQVRPTKFRVLSRITAEDNDEFQASYGKCSTWARRHDKSPEFNHVSPEPSDLEQELELVRSWRKRIKAYRSD